MSEERSSEVQAWWYISFADPGRPTGTQFLGACVVEAPSGDVAGAIKAAWAHGCNPGGEALTVELPEGKEPPPGFPRYEVVSKGWMEQHGGTLNMSELE